MGSTTWSGMHPDHQPLQPWGHICLRKSDSNTLGGYQSIKEIQVILRRTKLIEMQRELVNKLFRAERVALLWNLLLGQQQQQFFFYKVSTDPNIQLLFLFPNPLTGTDPICHHAKQLHTVVRLQLVTPLRWYTTAIDETICTDYWPKQRVALWWMKTQKNGKSSIDDNWAFSIWDNFFHGYYFHTHCGGKSRMKWYPTGHSQHSHRYFSKVNLIDHYDEFL